MDRNTREREIEPWRIHICNWYYCALFITPWFIANPGNVHHTGRMLVMDPVNAQTFPHPSPQPFILPPPHQRTNYLPVCLNIVISTLLGVCACVCDLSPSLLIILTMPALNPIFSVCIDYFIFTYILYSYSVVTFSLSQVWGEKLKDHIISLVHNYCDICALALLQTSRNRYAPSKH